MNVLLFADRNPRAAIAILRGLRGTNASVYVALSAASNRRRVFTNYAKIGRKNVIPLTYSSETQAEFLQSLDSIRQEIGPFTIFPLGEEILRWCVGRRESLARDGICLPMVGLSEYERVSDKFSFVKLAVKHGLDVPIQRDRVPAKFESKFVVKPRVGADARKGVLERPLLVESSAILEKLHQSEFSEEQHFIQEYLCGPSYYYCAMYQHGEKRLEFTQKTVTQQPNGLSVIKAVPATLPPTVTEKIDSLFRDLSWQGVMMFELKKASDRYCAIECNPRFWGPLQLATDNGVNFPNALLQLASDQPVDIPHIGKRGNIGYLWRTGYLHGAIVRRRTGAEFQNHSESADKRVRYRDIWIRRDTFFYSVLEPIFILSPLVRAVWSLMLNKLRLR